MTGGAGRRARIYITRPLPGEPERRLEPLADVIVCPDPEGADRKTLLREAGRSDGLLCVLTDRIDEELLSVAPRLAIVSNCAVGVDNIDIAAASRRGIPVGHTPEVLTDATADLALALLLATARRIPEADRLIRSEGFPGWRPTLLLGSDLAGKVLGLVGFGRIGRAVARRAHGFGMLLRYTARHRAPEILEEELGAAFRPLEALLEESDFVSLHVPLSPATRHLIDAAALARMKPTAILVNTARGSIVDEASLARALTDGRLAGAGLDVYEKEPELHPALLDAPNTVLVPHIGSATIETRRRMADIAAQNIAALLQGKRPPHIVNPEVIQAGGGKPTGS